jgi:hypothetical protein
MRSGRNGHATGRGSRLMTYTSVFIFKSIHITVNRMTIDCILQML